LCSRSKALSDWISRAQPFARRRLPCQPPRWPSDISERIQSRSPSFRVHVQFQPPASLPNSAAARTIGRECVLILNHFHVLSSLSDLRRALTALHQPICHVIRRSGLKGARITSDRRTVQAIKRVCQNVDGFKDVLADRAGFQGAPRSPPIRFRQCDPRCSRSRAQPQQPNGVCRPGRPRAHEAGLPRSRHWWLSQLRMPVPLAAI
jgi:hypothetical protein